MLMSAFGKPHIQETFFPPFFIIPSANKAKSLIKMHAQYTRQNLKSRSYKATTSIIYAQLHSKHVIYNPNFNIN